MSGITRNTSRLGHDTSSNWDDRKADGIVFSIANISSSSFSGRMTTGAASEPYIARRSSVLKTKSPGVGVRSVFFCSVLRILSLFFCVFSSKSMRCFECLWPRAKPGAMRLLVEKDSGCYTRPPRRYCQTNTNVQCVDQMFVPVSFTAQPLLVGNIVGWTEFTLATCRYNVSWKTCG